MRFAVLVLVACGSSPRAPAHVDRPQPVAKPAPVIAPATASDAQCKQLIAHALDLGVAEDGAAMTPERRASLQIKLEADYGPPCRALTVDEVQCGIAAKTLADLERCDQRSDSSSTSNRSVELPGMSPPPTPAAP